MVTNCDPPAAILQKRTSPGNNESGKVKVTLLIAEGEVLCFHCQYLCIIKHQTTCVLEI